MDVTFSMSFCVLRLEYEHLIELLRAFRSVLEHGAHRGVAVDIGVFALRVIIFRILKCKIFIGLHQPGVHISYSGTFRSVEYELLGSSGMAVFDENLLNGVLNLLYCRDFIVLNLCKIELDLSCQIIRCISVLSAQNFCCFIDGI